MELSSNWVFGSVVPCLNRDQFFKGRLWYIFVWVMLVFGRVPRMTYLFCVCGGGENAVCEVHVLFFLGVNWTSPWSRWWFQIFFIFTTYLGKCSNLTNICSKGLVQPPPKLLVTSNDPEIRTSHGLNHLVLSRPLKKPIQKSANTGAMILAPMFCMVGWDAAGGCVCSCWYDTLKVLWGWNKKCP